MDNPPTDNSVVHSRLSRISTIWTMLADAHEGTEAEAATARLAFVQRYQRAAYRYLLGALKDADAADELFQEMVFRFVRGDFRRADPEKGRFRYYLKTTLAHLVTDYHRRRLKRPTSLEVMDRGSADSVPDDREVDLAFVASWRAELLDRAWEKLERGQLAGGPPLYAVLRCRVENPDISSSELAGKLTNEQALQKTLTPENARKMLERARRQFADHLLDEVARSLRNPTPDDVELELSELDLLQFCRSALRRRM